MKIGGTGSIPATGVTAVTLNVTVTGATGATGSGSGNITAYADGTAVPGVSNIDYVPGETIPNAVVAPPGTDGAVAFLNGGSSAGSTELVVDLFGYFLDTEGIFN